jgi:hypothetical protein
MIYIITDWMNNVCFDSENINLSDFDEAMEVLDREIEIQMRDDGIEPYTNEGDESDQFGDYRGEYSIEEYDENIDRLFWTGQRYVLKKDYYKAV